MSAINKFRSTMKCADRIASSAREEVTPTHVAYALAATANNSDPVGAKILEYGRSRGWDIPAQQGRGGLFRTKHPAPSAVLRHAIENEVAAGRVSISSVLLLLQQQGELADLSQIVGEDGGDLRGWLGQSAQ